MTVETNQSALRAMVHFVTRAYSLEPERLGSIRLHKILWNAEVRSVRKTGYPIAGETFVKRQFGPCAEHLDAVVDDLRQSGRLRVIDPEEAYEVRRYIAKGEPNHDALTPDQWHILESTMQWIVGDHTATSISERSHGEVWEGTAMLEQMSVDAEAVQFVQPRGNVEEEIARHVAGATW